MRSLTSLLLISLVGLPISSASAEGKIPIGISSTLSGEAATYGTDIKNVLLFANEKIGHERFELIIEDDKCNGKDAVAAAEKLVNVDKVKAVIGYGCSGALLAAAPIFEKAKIPAMGTETSAAKIAEAGDYIFRTQPSDAIGVKVLYEYLAKHHKIFGAISAQTDFCQGIVEDLKKLNSNGTLQFENANVLSSDTDFKPVLLKLRAKNIDGLFVNAQDEGGAYRMIRQAKELGMNVPFYTFYMGASDAFYKLAGKDAEGVITVDGPSFEDIASPEGVALMKEFTDKYGPMKAWRYGFATVFEAFHAMSEALTSDADPREYLAKTEFNGIFGPYSFDKNGDVVGISLVLKKNVNGSAKVIE